MSFLSEVMSIGKMTKVQLIVQGTSALYWAVKEKKQDLTEALLKAGPNPSPKLKKDGSTPLHISAYYRAKDLGIARQRSYVSQASQAALV